MNARPTVISTEVHQRSLGGKLPFEPTVSQSKAIYALSRFLSSPKERCVLLIKGYAGTGKTTLMQALVSHLSSIGMRSVLLAPTGRAAKVLSSYAGHPGYTIHRHIYRRTMDSSGISHFSLSPNQSSNQVYIVDEASMIGNEKGVLFNGLLQDLLEYVFSGSNSRLVMLGDDAQLPPVGLAESPALDVEKMALEFNITIAACTLTEVVRQSEGSSILSLANVLRIKVFGERSKDLTLNYKMGPDVRHISSQDLEEALESCYAHFGKEDVRVICRSNKNANLYNHQIRTRIFQLDDRLAAGELLMVVRNNYLWTSEDGNLPFIANGELCELMYVKNQRSMYELDFATLGLSFPDHGTEPSIECTAMLDVLDENSASLPDSRMQQLYNDVKVDISQEVGPGETRARLQKDPWYNALQVKYGYAITCHKAQGGQWPIVFVDRGYVTEDRMDKEYWRWLYTAVTRATEKLYLINFYKVNPSY